VLDLNSEARLENLRFHRGDSSQRTEEIKFERLETAFGKLLDAVEMVVNRVDRLEEAIAEIAAPEAGSDGLERYRRARADREELTLQRERSASKKHPNKPRGR